MNRRIAIFVATSGHSGVDRAMRHLIPAMARRGFLVDLLKVRGHGPELNDIPEGVRVVDLGSSHVYNSLGAVVRYLRRERPAAMLSDKDRVNRTALLARALAGTDTRVLLRSGTTISVDLAHRGWFERWLQRFSMGWLYRFADGVLVPCAAVADDMSAYTGLPRERIQAVPSPIVPARLFSEEQPRPEHPWFAPGQPPVILGMGELGWRKDFATLVRGFARVRAQMPCRLLILGKGRQRQELLDLAESLGVGADVALPGFVEQPFGYVAHAAVFALTSRWEGLSFALAEALAVGTPSVATDCPSGSREILQDGQYGPLVPVGDAEAVGQALYETLVRPLPKAVLQEGALPYEIERSATAYLRALGFEVGAGLDG